MNTTAVVIFVALFGLVTILGFVAARWRRGDLNGLHEWGLGGRRFGRADVGSESVWLVTRNVSRLDIGRPSCVRTTSGRFSISPVSAIVRLLMISSVAPSASTMTLPG